MHNSSARMRLHPARPSWTLNCSSCMRNGHIGSEPNGRRIRKFCACPTSRQLWTRVVLRKQSNSNGWVNCSRTLLMMRLNPRRCHSISATLRDLGRSGGREPAGLSAGQGELRALFRRASSASSSFHHSFMVAARRSLTPCCANSVSHVGT